MMTHIPLNNLIILGLSIFCRKKGYNHLNGKGALHLSKAEWNKIQQIAFNNNDIRLEGLYWLKVSKWQRYHNWNMY